MNGRSFRLGDIAVIERGYTDPPTEYMRFGNQNVLGIGITMAPSADVIVLGKALDAKAAELRRSLPAGLTLAEVTSMPQAVKRSVDDFVEAVAKPIAIVLLVSLISLGFRTGMVVVISIPLVLASTALCMYLFHIGLHKVSLGTLDARAGPFGRRRHHRQCKESMAVKLRARLRSGDSGSFRLHEHGLSHAHGNPGDHLRLSSDRSREVGDRGEYTRSIFEVSAIALLLSWLAAVIVIPLLGASISCRNIQRAAR